MATERQPIVIMATSETHCLGDLLIRHYSGELPAVIRAVVSNHEKFKPLVEAFGIPFHYAGHHNLERTAHEDLVGDVLPATRRNTSCSRNTCASFRRKSSRVIPTA
jgi:formyltetrahydrofolate hydrolase